MDTTNPFPLQVSLPQFAAPVAYAVATSIISTATSRRLPGQVNKAVARLKKKAAALGHAIEWRPPKLKINKHKADRAEDDGFRAIESFLKAFLFMDVESPQAGPVRDRAQKLLETLFPDGLYFLKEPYESEWSFADAIVRRMNDSGIAGEIIAMGGKPLIDNLFSVHQRYGLALGMVSPPEPSLTDERVEAPRRELMDALRDYVLKVMAHVDLDDPATTIFAQALLKPLSDHAAKTAPAPAPPETAPAPIASATM